MTRGNREMCIARWCARVRMGGMFFYACVQTAQLGAANISTAHVSIPSRDGQITETFYDAATRQLRTFMSSVTSFTAHVDITRRAIGIQHPIRMEGMFQFTAPDTLSMIVTGSAPYSVTVSASEVVTHVPLIPLTDTRSLYPGESLWEHFLGIILPEDERDFLIRFRVENDIYIITGERRAESLEALREDPAENAWQIVWYMLRLTTHTGELRETRTRTLVGEETHIIYRSVQATYHDTTDEGEDDAE